MEVLLYRKNKHSRKTSSATLVIYFLYIVVFIIFLFRNYELCSGVLLGHVTCTRTL